MSDAHTAPPPAPISLELQTHRLTVQVPHPQSTFPTCYPAGQLSRSLRVCHRETRCAPSKREEVGLTPPGLSDLWAQHAAATWPNPLGRSCCHSLPFSLFLGQRPFMPSSFEPWDHWRHSLGSLSWLRLAWDYINPDALFIHSRINFHPSGPLKPQ